MKGKIYLVTFTLSRSGIKVWKMGYHKGPDVMNRFKSMINNNTIQNFKIRLSVWVDLNILEQTEQDCFQEIIKEFGGYKGRFKNFYLYKGMINGLTEMRLHNEKEIQYAYKMLEKKGNRYLVTQ